MNEYIQRFKELAKRPVFLKAATAVGIIVIVLILISDLSDNKKDDSNHTNEEINFVTADAYASDMESQLKTVLMSIKGVGKADVMLTITSTEEYIYAETVKKGTSQSETGYVMIDNGSQKEALVKKIKNPSIGGVVIVCEGGDDPRICEKIYRAVSTALNISTSKIYVTKMK